MRKNAVCLFLQPGQKIGPASRQRELHLTRAAGGGTAGAAARLIVSSLVAAAVGQHDAPQIAGRGPFQAPPEAKFAILVGEIHDFWRFWLILINFCPILKIFIF